jgi:hypothetical protein
MPKAVKAKRARLEVDNPHIQGDMGMRHVLKPVGNKDIPADSTITNIKVIGNGDGFAPFVKHSAKDNGAAAVQNQQQTLIFEFREEEMPSVGPLESNPMAIGKQEIPVQKIYDIDMEFMLKKVEEPTSHLLASEAPGGAGTYTAVHKYLEGGAPAGDDYDIQASGWSPPNVLTDSPVGRREAAFAVVVIPRSKQKLLGDWLQKNTAASGSNIGQLFYMDVQLFDDLNYQIKPIYSSLFLPRQENEAPQSRMHVILNGLLESIPVPEQHAVNKVTWERIEFHRFQDAQMLTNAESFANSLLISVVGTKASFNNFDELRLRIFHKQELVERQTLDYWATNISRFMFETAAGSRHIFTPADHTHNWEFSGIITSQIGNIIPLADMKINPVTSETNILQDTAETARVPGWYF